MKSIKKSDKKTFSVENERKKMLQEFCKRVNLKFNDLSVLDLAFHHRSVTNELHSGNNERLEFLGDSVLGMITAAYLYKNINVSEGEMSKIKSAVVSEKSLAPIALKLGLDKLLILGHGEEKTGGRQKPAILADCMEAVIGACYYDQGFFAAEKYVLSFMIPKIESYLNDGEKDFKSILQEVFQQKYKICPVYELKGISGPEHDKTFEMVVHLGQKTYGPAKGKSKKEAQQKVAKMALDSLKD